MIHLRNLQRFFGELLALDVEDAVLPAGCVGLLGPNAAGKTTLLQILLGLLPPSRGEVEVLGFDVKSRSMAVRERVGYMSEIDSFIPGLTGFQFVSLAGEVCGLRCAEARRRAHEVLDYVGVGEERYRRVEEYSSGSMQKLKLAQALVHDPELLILDEPTNGLDPTGRRLMLDLISRLYRDLGKSVMLSSHLLGDVGRICEFVVILEKGRIAAHGPMDELLRRSGNRYSMELAGNHSGFLKALQDAGARIDVLRETDDGGLELLVEVPGDFPPRRFFELVARESGEARKGASNGAISRSGDDAGDRAAATGSHAAGVVLRGLARDEESLEDLFQRAVRAPRSGPEGEG